MRQTIRLAGELSHYIVDTNTQRVHQIKTNRRTGREFATDITATKKGAEVWQRAYIEHMADLADAASY